MSENKLPTGFGSGFKSEPGVKIDPKTIVDVEGNPLIYGKDDDDPTLGPDDAPQFAMRTLEDYPNIPMEVKQAEIKYILPMANHIAGALGINIIDEKMYEKTLDQLKQRSLFVLLNLAKMNIHDNIASWFGLILTCKKHPLVLVRFKMQLGTGKIGIDQCRLWDKSAQQYVVIRNTESKALMDRAEISAKILDYLKHEYVCNV